MTDRSPAAALRTVALALAAALALGACNTIRGAGEDIQTGGEAIEGAAKETQQEMNDGNPQTP